MGFMNVFVFFFITAEVHTHIIIFLPTAFLKRHRHKNCQEKTLKKKVYVFCFWLLFLFLLLVSFSVSVLSVSFFLFLFSPFSVSVSRYYLSSLLRLRAAVQSSYWVFLSPFFPSRLEEIWSSYNTSPLVTLWTGRPSSSDISPSISLYPSFSFFSPCSTSDTPKWEYHTRCSTKRHLVLKIKYIFLVELNVPDALWDLVCT